MKRYLRPNKLNEYFQICIDKQAYQIHRLVIFTFKGPEPKDLVNPVVNHTDGNKLNNYIGNLEWTTIRGNTQHAHDTGLIKNEGVIQYTKEGVEIARYINAAKAHKKLELLKQI